MKRLIWAFRFYPFVMLRGFVFSGVGGFMLFQEPPESAISAVAESVVWQFGAIPWYLSVAVGVMSFIWALFLGADAYKGG